MLLLGGGYSKVAKYLHMEASRNVHLTWDQIKKRVTIVPPLVLVGIRAGESRSPHRPKHFFCYSLVNHYSHSVSSTVINTDFTFTYMSNRLYIYISSTVNFLFTLRIIGRDSLLDIFKERLSVADANPCIKADMLPWLTFSLPLVTAATSVQGNEWCLRYLSSSNTYS